VLTTGWLSEGATDEDMKALGDQDTLKEELEIMATLINYDADNEALARRILENVDANGGPDSAMVLTARATLRRLGAMDLWGCDPILDDRAEGAEDRP
jgi:hypothetical protein